MQRGRSKLTQATPLVIVIQCHPHHCGRTCRRKLHTANKLLASRDRALLSLSHTTILMIFAQQLTLLYVFLICNKHKDDLLKLYLNTKYKVFNEKQKLKFIHLLRQI
jgi:hypothetical protein